MKNHKIFYAEDDSDDIELFETVLREYHPDIQLQVATDGYAAVQNVTAFQPNLIVLDLNLPRKSGRQCLVELQSQFGGVVPIVVFSTTSTKGDVDFCLKSGATRFYTKPATYNKYVELVNGFCTGILP